MMASFTPRAVRLVDAYDDGLDTRHVTFECIASGTPYASEGAPGEFFLLSVPGHGEAAFTYVSLPDARGRFDAVVRRVGELTAALHATPVGAVLGCRGPFGRGWPLAELAGRRVLVVAGGCGLAPLACAIDTLGGMRDGTRVAVAYGSRNEASQVLARERARWKGHLPIVESFDAPASSASLRGTPIDHLDRACAAWGSAAPERGLVCGPEVMMDASAEALVARGVRPEHIWLSLERRMHCGVGLCGHCYVAETYACVDGPTYRWDVLCALRAKSPRRPPGVTEIHHC
jgi:NAD(P)H-flavin reductase